jgi:hypothetical protein
MAKTIRCECGFVARGDSDDQVIGVIRGHMVTDHPALLDTVSWGRPPGLDPGRLTAYPASASRRSVTSSQGHTLITFSRTSVRRRPDRHCRSDRGGVACR